MPAWRREAIKRLPEFQKEIAHAGSVMFLWFHLTRSFEDAYREPRNESLIERIYSYADWCTQTPRTNDSQTDPFTALSVAFLEEIPKIPAAREDMPRWFSYEQVRDSREIFSYKLEEDEFQALLEHIRKNAHRLRRKVTSK